MLRCANLLRDLAFAGCAMACCLLVPDGHAEGRLPGVTTQSQSRAATVKYPAMSATAPRLAKSVLDGLPVLDVTRAGRRLVAVGEWGAVLTSDNSGRTWQQARVVPTAVTLTAVRFANAEDGWAVGHQGVIIHTTDGGLTWTMQLTGVRAERLALQPAAGLAAVSGAGTLRQAADASRAERLAAEIPSEPFLCVEVESRTEAVALGAFNLAFRTSDGGKEWEDWMRHIDNPQGLHLYGAMELDGRLIIAGEDGTLFEAAAGGGSFNRATVGDGASLFGALAIGHDSGVVYGLLGAVYVSENGGKTWQRSDSGTESSVSAATVLSSGSVVIGTVSGEILASTDSGRTFRVIGRVNAPITGIAPAPDGALILSTIKGMRRIAATSASELRRVTK